MIRIRPGQIALDAVEQLAAETDERLAVELGRQRPAREVVAHQVGQRLAPPRRADAHGRAGPRAGGRRGESGAPPP